MDFRTTNWKRAVYAFLLLVWALVVAWQVVEHRRVKAAASEALINRSRDITTTLGLVIRSQRRFGFLSQERLESALNELVKSGELRAVAMFNATGEIVASAGKGLDLEKERLTQGGILWEDDHVKVINLVDIGANVAEEGEPSRPTIVLPRRDENDTPRADGPGRSGPGSELRREGGTPPDRSTRSEAEGAQPEDEDDDRRQGRRPPWDNDRNDGDRERVRDRDGDRGRDRDGDGDGDRRRRGFGRPPWMSENEYEQLIARRGLHGLAMVMSHQAYYRVAAQDLWMRGMISAFATAAILALILAWRTMGRSSELQIRLLRASEVNAHLKEMNLAAAGLAHETRNPLNIIRGLAQMISRDGGASSEVQARSRNIVDEADQVTAQLNEFINYSRPREARRTPVALGSVIAEVSRALDFDLKEKNIDLQASPGEFVIKADEQLLRQVLFNLLLNAIQALEAGGKIEVVAQELNSGEVTLDVRDNGRGIEPEHRSDVFKPYFTTTQTGTGLGLAVVQHIVLAHGWEIECLANEPQGAIFRIKHIKTTRKPVEHVV